MAEFGVHELRRPGWNCDDCFGLLPLDAVGDVMPGSGTPVQSSLASRVVLPPSSATGATCQDFSDCDDDWRCWVGVGSDGRRPRYVGGVRGSCDGNGSLCLRRGGGGGTVDGGGPSSSEKHFSSSCTQRQQQLIHAYTRYRTAKLGNRVHSTSLYHSRQCGTVLKPRSYCIGYTVVCFMTNKCNRKLWKRFQCKLIVV